MRPYLLAALLVAATACSKYKEDPLPDSLPAYKDTVTVDSGGAMRSTSLYGNVSYSYLAPGDSGTYKVQYTLAAPLPATDTVQLRLGNDSLSALTARRAAQRDSATFKVKKIYGHSVKWYACRRVLRGNAQVQGEKCTTWITNLPPRQPDSVWVDSTLAIAKLDIKPDHADLTYGAKTQFCAFIVFKGGQVAMRSPDKLIAECPVQYASFPPERRAPTTAQQSIADRTCIKWEARGGNITAEPCGTNNPLLGHPA